MLVTIKHRIIQFHCENNPIKSSREIIETINEILRNHLPDECPQILDASIDEDDLQIGDSSIDCEHVPNDDYGLSANGRFKCTKCKRWYTHKS